jgi:hypothetical protein
MVPLYFALYVLYLAAIQAIDEFLHGRLELDRDLTGLMIVVSAHLERGPDTKVCVSVCLCVRVCARARARASEHTFPVKEWGTGASTKKRTGFPPLSAAPSPAAAVRVQTTTMFECRQKHSLHNAAARIDKQRYADDNRGECQEHGAADRNVRVDDRSHLGRGGLRSEHAARESFRLL